MHLIDLMSIDFNSHSKFLQSESFCNCLKAQIKNPYREGTKKNVYKVIRLPVKSFDVGSLVN